MARPLRILGPVLKNILIAMAALVACAPGAEDTAPCTIASNARELDADIWETSGLALSRRTPGVLWTHNDSGNEPFLYAFDSTGTIMGHVRVSGAALIDWEDMAAGPCNAGTCLFIADIGDNRGRRDSISIYVVPEPLPTDSTTGPATVYHARYPGRAQDAEAIFVLPSGDLYVVTKGRRDSIALYRYAKSDQQPGRAVTLERVRALWPRPSSSINRVTGASASPGGERVAIRTYGTLLIYETDSLLGSGAPRLTSSLRGLGESRARAWPSVTAVRSGSPPRAKAGTTSRCLRASPVPIAD